MTENNQKNNCYSIRFCDERHTKIDQEFKAVWERLKSLETKFWAIIVLLVANLIAPFIEKLFAK